MLSLVGLDILTLPDSVYDLTSLQALFLDHDSFQLPRRFGELASLQLLYLEGSYDFPPSFTQLSSLTELHLIKCDISELQGGLESLGRLKELELTRCDTFRDIPFSLPRSLEVLQVENDLDTTYLTDLSQLPNLTDLTLDLPDLEHGVEMSRGLTQLRHLTLRLPDTDTELPLPLTFPQLRSLTICAAGFEKLPEDIATTLPQLRKLNVEWTESLDTMLASMSELRSLTSLEISADGADISSVPVTISSLPRLRKLCVYGRRLNMAGCPRLPVEILDD
ncbi:unnamed protein product [Closterium sp. Yama58-4]|nr:unnamed protein product [Closterium sp. Yama58-4]